MSQFFSTLGYAYMQSLQCVWNWGKRQYFCLSCARQTRHRYCLSGVVVGVSGRILIKLCLTLLHSDRPKLYNFGLSERNRVKTYPSVGRTVLREFRVTRKTDIHPMIQIRRNPPKNAFVLLEYLLYYINAIKIYIIIVYLAVKSWKISVW